MQYMREEVDRLVNDMQNSSLNEGSNASAEIPNASHVNTNSVQSTNQSKQGPRNLSGKDSSHPIQQKGKQTGTVKGNNSKIKYFNTIENKFTAYKITLYKKKIEEILTFIHLLQHEVEFKD